MKRSLHIGINNYPGTNMDLAGCVNDAEDWQKALEYRKFITTLLLDEDASKENMVESIKKIVADTGRDDIAVITYSGHGTWVPDEDSDEADGRDEALCPYDITSGNILTDDELYEIFSERKRGARIIIISDSCHSGTVVRAARIIPGTEEDHWKFQKIRYLAPEFYIGDDRIRLGRARQVEKIRATGKIRAAAVLLSGCKDDEYSYDAWFNERPNGAFTYVALQAFKNLSEVASYKEWYTEIRKVLPHVQYPQTPQLSGSRAQLNTWKVFKE
ncbi:MAG: caspase family protein [Spirochaetales bacterium]|nr:caspase family protein [Spirochaetales bacterium]